MSFWTAAVIIAAIVTFGGIYRSRTKASTNKTDADFEALQRRVDRLEERMANLETLVLDKEKAKPFSEL